VFALDESLHLEPPIYAQLIGIIILNRGVFTQSGEIVADRGIHHHVGNEGWEHICQAMEALFRRGEFEAGVLLGIEKIGAILAQHSVLIGVNKNEVSNKPVIL